MVVHYDVAKEWSVGEHGKMMGTKPKPADKKMDPSETWTESGLKKRHKIGAYPKKNDNYILHQLGFRWDVMRLIGNG